MTSEAETTVNITFSKTIPFLATESQSNSFISYIPADYRFKNVLGESLPGQRRPLAPAEWI